MVQYIMMIAILLIFSVAIWVIVRQHYKRQSENVLHEILQKLDRAISGNVQETKYDESISAAITERLNRLIQISSMNQVRSEKECDTIKSLVSDITHQVRTPLSNIMLYAELLKEQKLDAQSDMLVDKLQKQSAQLEFFMKELVKTSYTEQKIISLTPQMTSVEEIVDTACQMVELAAMAKEINIIQKEMSVLCYADKKWTTEALANVLDNAVKYSPHHSTIWVRVIPYESFVCIQVQDQGMGIKEDEQGKVFERFYRSTSVSSESGFGIGLYLVRAVLSKQGGYAKIQSGLGKGTIVQMFLSRKPI